MNTIVIGIDLGLSGAIAILNGSLSPVIVEMPKVESAKGRPTLDLHRICQYAVDHFGVAENTRKLVVAEQLHAMPMDKGGSAANFARGYALGSLCGMLVARGIPYQLVAPQTWQKAMLLGVPGDDTKQRSLIAAQRLFPGVSLLRTPRCKKMDDGFSDALLLAEWGRRQLGAV